MTSILSKSKMAFVAICILTVLSGCSGQRGPDEYMVLKQAPLSLPPDFYLSPNGPTKDIDEVIDPQELAKRALFGVN
jgi:hypothetical protein